MHPNLNFRKASPAQNLYLARARGFVTLAINDENGPLISQIPFLVSADDDFVEAHLVRSNPILARLEKEIPAVLSISGSDAYISPDWYGIDDQVPTWNYVTVQLRGKLQRLPQDALTSHLKRLSAQFERLLLPKPMWTLDKMNDDALHRMMRMIVPVRLEITDIDGTWKLGQNKSDEVRLAAADGVAETGIGMETAKIAELMRNPPW